jgi:4-carboxymuconolactone decarboxylase
MRDRTRLPLIEPDEKDGVAAEVFAQILDTRGEVTNLFRVVANEPTLLPAFFGLSRRVRDGSTLSARLSQLAILATAFTIGCEYETVHHLIDAQRAGVTPGEIARLSDLDLGAFSPDERSVILFARQVTAGRTVDDAIFEDVLEALGAAGTIELAVLVGWYHLVAAVVEPLRVAVEAGKRREAGTLTQRPRTDSTDSGSCP